MFNKPLVLISDFCMKIFLLICKILLPALQVIKIPVEGGISTVIKDFFNGRLVYTFFIRKREKKKPVLLAITLLMYKLSKEAEDIQYNNNNKKVYRKIIHGWNWFEMFFTTISNNKQFSRLNKHLSLLNYNSWQNGVQSHHSFFIKGKSVKRMA